MRYNRLNFAMALIKWLKKNALVIEMNAPLSYEYRKYCRHIFQLPIIPELTEKLSLKAADCVYVVSDELKMYYLKQSIPSNKIFVVPNGASIERFDNTYNEKTELVELMVAKNRNGPTRNIEMIFIKGLAQFYNAATVPS